MIDVDTVARLVEAELYRRDGKRHGDRIRFRCVNPRHVDEHPSADYSVSRRAWLCRACGARGGLVSGETPIATALGVVTDERWKDPGYMAQLAAERDEAVRAVEREKAKKAEALHEYWEARRGLATSRARLAVVESLLTEGISQIAIEHFAIAGGDYLGVPAVLLPWTVRGEIRALQYRLSDSAAIGRYRWHEGSRPSIYNADAVLEPQDDTVVIVEGAKKCAALWSHGVVSVCGIANKTAWRQEWAPRFQKFDRVLFALDPDAWTQARDAALTIPNARVVRLPMKPDDMLVATGGDVDLLASYLDRAERAA